MSRQRYRNAMEADSTGRWVTVNDHVKALRIARGDSLLLKVELREARGLLKEAIATPGAKVGPVWEKVRALLLETTL